MQGQMISVTDYYQKTLNVRLRYSNAPLVKKRENSSPWNFATSFLYLPISICLMIVVTISSKA
jgi:hypothetical protein